MGEKEKKKKGVGIEKNVNFCYFYYKLITKLQKLQNYIKILKFFTL
jgi:hypothetical protein